MQQPDWSLLPPELVQLISEKIPCITDYVYYRAVCWSWRLASLPKPGHLPPQLPWLLLPKTLRDEIITEAEILFYDLYRSKVSTLRHPVIQGSRICGTSHGWLILQKSREVVLLNPVTRASVPVASLSGVPNIFPIPGKTKLSPSDWIIEGDGYVKKAILTCTPLPDSGCIVVGLFRTNWKIAFCRIGDEHWTLLEEEEEYHADDYDERFPFIEDIAWHHKSLYAIDFKGGVYIYDLYSPSKQYVPVVLPTRLCFAHKTPYLVEGASEPMATRYSVLMREMQESSTPDSSVHVKPENEVFGWRNEGQPGWHQVYDIGNFVLFVNGTRGRTRSVVCELLPLQLNRWCGNQICCVSQLHSRGRPTSSIESIELKELGNGYVEEIANFKDIVPGYYNVPLDPIWFTPSYF